ncbi:uncharacterized protein N7515_002510 [Penicillium bovifimosum]|uniref:Uncharacterized protein n=1 Tax=Penicillium bovifimosum TaxID=126998 RepID=A0A9W9HDT4_9EURO|nr:uncharacterized protein N7515_002510 [Penicillium bovifimosum]KAJ5143723.1 hypothetical protein N7515_002510 [Penicillium bovifimosum]
MLIRHPLLVALTLLAVPTGVLSRKGGGGDIDSDSSSSSPGGSGGSSDYDDSSDSSGSDDTYTPSTPSSVSCTDTHRLNLEDMQPDHYDKYNREPRRGHASAYSEYDGVFFKGEASFTYTIEPVPNKTTEMLSSSKVECPAGERTMRMLGAAWVAARAPEPAGLSNPITIGFKAWESNIRLADIDYSYSVCDKVDVVRLSTTVDWIENDEDEAKAMDAVELNITQAAGNSDMVEFDGVYDLKSWADSERDDGRPERYDNPGLSDQLIILPEGLCSDGNKLGEIITVWPTGTYFSGSMTNDTLELSMSGSTVTGFKERNRRTPDTKVNVTFEITFTGRLDAANSTQVVLTGASNDDASLFSFERATGGASAMTMSFHCVLLCFLVGFGLMVV